MWEDGEITAVDAMKRLKMNRGTFYRFFFCHECDEYKNIQQRKCKTSSLRVKELCHT